MQIRVNVDTFRNKPDHVVAYCLVSECFTGESNRDDIVPNAAK